MRTLLVLAALLVGLLPVASSHGGWTHCGAQDIEAGDGGSGTLYVVPEGNGVWLYQESNGIRHLQRGGASEILPDDVETCDECDVACGPEMMVF